MLNFLLCSIAMVLLFPSKAICQHQEIAENCSFKSNCKDCIQLGTCAWCAQSNNCFNLSEVTKGFCPEELTYNPDNSFSIIRADLLSSSKSIFNFGGKKNSKNYVNGEMKLELRPKSTYSLNNIQYTAADFPVNLYCLVDLPKSMQDEKQKHAETLLQEMKMLTKNLFLGFGTIEGEKFINHMPLTENVEQFPQNIKEHISAEHDSNNTQLSYAGIIRTLCETVWSRHSKNILVVLTTNDYSSSLIPSNNYTCSHPDPLEFYSELNELASSRFVNIIFVVKEQDESGYRELSQKIQGSHVAVLDDKLDRVTELIKFIYSFYDYLIKSPTVNNTISYRHVTIFAPTNEAFQHFDRLNRTFEVLYHISTTAYTQEEFPKPPKAIPTDLDGNPHLFITKNRQGDIFVNNARLIPSRSMILQNSVGKRQVLHVIEEVLEPMTTIATANTEITNPDAFQFLQNADQMKIGNFRLRSYRSQVTLMKKENLYQSPGGHTFLIPIDEGFKQTTRSGLVDNKVIDGHIILNNVLFTSAAPMETPQTTGAFEDNIKVTVSFFPQNGKIYVKSNTIMGDAKHSTGVVMAEIVKSNIPLRNGVAHLIQRPLMVIDTSVEDFLKDHENGALHKFYEVIMSTPGDILGQITKLGEVTILAPSNEAWNNSNIEELISGGHKKEIENILNMHVIKGRIDSEQIRQKNELALTSTTSTIPVAFWPTINNKNFIYFNINEKTNETILTVEGGGVNATLIQPDVAQTNGYVHIIDRVLGIPYTTVLGKMKTDPMVSDTYHLGTYSEFNQQLNNSQRQYTFFVSTNYGWNDIKIKNPSAHKKLFMKAFAYHSESILQRHLVISNKPYPIQELVDESKTSDSLVLPTYRDTLRIRVVEENSHETSVDYPDEFSLTEYYILWRAMKIKVIRPDIQCTNGVIHVIELPLMEERDIMVTGSSGIQTEPLISILFIYLVKLLL